MNRLYRQKLRLLSVVFLFVMTILPFSSAHAQTWEEGTTRLHLVSVGTGNPDNITLRAVNVIRDADIVFCDRRIRDKFPVLLRDKEIHDIGFGIFGIYGKPAEEARKNRRFNYEEKVKELKQVDAVIRAAVKNGKRVAVLDSGDPTIYGPHMWYLEAFEDLNPEVVPGISCFNAANAALKKGVTSGKNTHSVILTASFGREGSGGTDSIEKLAANRASMVFFTMFLNMDEVVKKLRVHYPAETPVAIVLNAGYRDKERVIRGTLGTILAELKGEKLPFEHLIYVGDFLSNRYHTGGK